MTELEKLRKHASDRSWTQASKISSLEVELVAAREKIGQLEESSSVAPWIDFDDYKAFEGVLMIFA